MNREEINKLIVESNLLITTVTNGYQVWMPENLEKFAELVAATEREACAKEISAEINDEIEDEAYWILVALLARIRARGNNGT